MIDNLFNNNKKWLKDKLFGSWIDNEVSNVGTVYLLGNRWPKVADVYSIRVSTRII